MEINRRRFFQIGLAAAASEMLAQAEPSQAQGAGISILANRARTYRNIEVIASNHPRAEKYIPLVLDAVEKHHRIYYVDPVLFLGLIKRESNFGKHLISPVGAAGPVQLMPSTAKDMGLNVYMPGYFSKARKLSGSATRNAIQAIEELKKSNWNRAVKSMKQSHTDREKAKKHYDRYGKELRSQIAGKREDELVKVDGRFVDPLAVDRGVRHLAYLLKKRDGDIREALSAYNAGLRRVTNAFGIPYIKETVDYQNRVFNFYKYWSVRAI